MILPLLPVISKAGQSIGQRIAEKIKPKVDPLIEKLNDKTGIVDAGKAFFADPQAQQDIINRDLKRPRDLLMTGAAVLGLDTGFGKVDDVARAGKEVGSIDKVVSKLVSAINDAKPIRKTTEALYTAERAKRVATGAERLAQGGEQGFKAALGALKGELPKANFESARSLFSQDEVDQLFNHIKDHPTDFFDKINAATGLSKILGKGSGSIPTDSELKTLQKIFGPGLITAVRSKRPAWDKVKEGIANVLNVPRAVMSSFDMSAPFRQGVVLVASKPKQGADAFKEMVKYFGSEKIFKAAMEEISNRPSAPLMKQSGLAITDIGGQAIGLSNKEEQFMSNLAERIPILGRVVKASERAYVGFLNKIRADVFDNLSNEFIKGGIDPSERPEVFKNLAEFVNTASGRGNLGKLSTAAPLLNGIFFSPRFMASRVRMLNPAWYFKLEPEVRKEAAKDFLTFVGAGIGALSLAKLGGASVETDPRSTDFGKIRLGNTRYDVWAGFQQWVRVAAQLITGEVESTSSGRIRPLDKKVFPNESRLDHALSFIEGKLAPVPGLITDLMRGQTLVGEPIASEQFYSKLIPLYMQDLVEAAKDSGLPGAAAVGLPAFFGVGVQTYKPTKTKKTSPLPALPALPSLPSLPTL